MAAITNRQFLSVAATRSGGELPHADLDAEAAKSIVDAIPPNSEILFAYPSPALRIAEKTEPIPHSWLIGYRLHGHTDITTLVLSGPRLRNIVWKHSGVIVGERIRGILIDDLLLKGGEWQSTIAGNTVPPAGIQLAGSLKAGRFRNCFARVLPHINLES